MTQKYLIRKTKDNKFIDMQTVNQEYIHQYQEVEQLEEKQGYYIETYYDKEEDIVKQRYLEIPKTKEELLEEEIIKIKKAIAENTKKDSLNELNIIIGSNGADDKSVIENKPTNTNKTDNSSIPDLSELDSLSE